MKNFLQSKGMAGGAAAAFAIVPLVTALKAAGIPMNPAQLTLAVCILIAALVGILEHDKTAPVSRVKRVAKTLLNILLLIAALYLSASSGTGSRESLVEIKPLTEVKK